MSLLESGNDGLRSSEASEVLSICSLESITSESAEIERLLYHLSITAYRDKSFLVTEPHLIREGGSPNRVFRAPVNHITSGFLNSI